MVIYSRTHQKIEFTRTPFSSALWTSMYYRTAPALCQFLAIQWMVPVFMKSPHNPIYYQLARNDSEITEKKSVGRQNFVKKKCLSLLCLSRLSFAILESQRSTNFHNKLHFAELINKLGSLCKEFAIYTYHFWANDTKRWYHWNIRK